MNKKLYKLVASILNKTSGSTTKRQNPLAEAEEDAALVRTGDFGKKYTISPNVATMGLTQGGQYGRSGNN